MKLNLRHFTDRFREASDNDERRGVFARLVLSMVLSATHGAKGELADRLGIVPSRVTAMLSGRAALGAHEIPFLDDESFAHVMGAIAGLRGFRLVALDVAEDDTHVGPISVIKQFTELGIQWAEALEDGRIDPAEGTEGMAAVEAARKVLDVLAAKYTAGQKLPAVARPHGIARFTRSA